MGPKLDYTDGRSCFIPQHHGKAKKGVVLRTRNIIEYKPNLPLLRQVAPEPTYSVLPFDAWVVGFHLFRKGQALWTGFCTNCPNRLIRVHLIFAQIGPSLTTCPARVFENPAEHRDDPHGGRSPVSKRLFDNAWPCAQVGPRFGCLNPSAMTSAKYAFGQFMILWPADKTRGPQPACAVVYAARPIGPEIF